MISLNKLAGLIAAVGFCRAVFLGAMGLLIARIVTFEQFVILALFGFAIDGVSVRTVTGAGRRLYSQRTRGRQRASE